MNKQISEKTKRRGFTVSGIEKSPKVLIETGKRVYTTANVKFTINSVRAS